MTFPFASGIGLDFDGGPGTFLMLAAMFVAAFVFAGTETAFFSLQKPDRERFARGTPTQRQVLALLQRRAPFITSILLGNELANTFIAATTAAVLAIYAPGKEWLNLVVLPPALVLVAEITPKVIAFRFAAQWTQVIVWPFTVWFWGATPVRVVFGSLVTLVQRAVGAEERNDSVAEEELLVYVDHGTRLGELDPSERDIIEAVFEFDDLNVGRLMTPRPDVFSVPLSTPWDQLLEKARQYGYSRIPVTGTGPDDILGVLLTKDLLKFKAAPLQSPKQLRSQLLPPVFVPASKMADSLLREFLERRFHMAFVVDEHGTLVGLVTLDDLLAELIGAHDDETADSEIERTEDAMSVRAGMDLEDFEEETGIALPSGDYHTLGGYVFHALGRLPRRGDAVSFQGREFVVSKMEGRRVAEILVRTVSPPTEPPSSASEGGAA